VRRERDDAFDGREGELDGAVVAERSVAAQTLPATPAQANVPCLGWVGCTGRVQLYTPPGYRTL
jgi:hypothetical protein